ncbi:aminotransferase class I/II-fold pyridoxal phosphate-dependent enzyme [Chitiniphilus purpureus]|uniref:Putative 8-amino-7-oxononanoate synthase n=1 Tax=Chitiniphilus purpureus TaxID=2981137 RepID=A0ABY6DKQ6_9NEIS|nr:aminotransferase class I/II-fold pyridoxal phosphate-dependent enzyme [Chitiniphilus sp. CD1]UXY14947.1 aminotransferase class I/II-fold pyridoxal phosphate-dependent enzyme [Chitiniphilus sp. CD1]
MVQTDLFLCKGGGAEDIFGHIRALIEGGTLGQGAALPPIRELAQMLEVNRNTVAAAYRKLVAAGLAEAAGRAGTRVAQRTRMGLPTGVHAFLPTPGMLELASGNPDPALLPELAPLLPHLAPMPTPLYGQPAYLPALQAWGRAWWERTGTLAAPLADPLLVNGALDGIERVLAVWLAPGDTVLVEEPCFPGSLNLLRQMGFNLVGLTLDGEGIEPAALEGALARKPKALLWTPYSHNPTGTNTSATRAAALRQLVDAHPELLIVEDDHFAGFATQPTPSLATPGRERWAAVRSLSKCLGPDLRLAFLAGDATTLARVQRRQYVGPRWPSFLLQRLALALLQAPGTAALWRRAGACYAERHAALVAALAARGLAALPGGGLNVWLPLADDAMAAQALAARGYLVRTGDAFRVTRRLGALRITSAALSGEETAAFAAVLAECLGGLGVAA